MTDLAQLAYEEFARTLVGAGRADRITPWAALDPATRQAWCCAIAVVEQELAVGTVHGRLH